MVCALTILVGASPSVAVSGGGNVPKKRQVYRASNPPRVPITPLYRVVRLRPGDPPTPGMLTYGDLRGGHSASPETSTIYSSRRMTRVEKAHELGHLLDQKHLSDGDREYFRRILRLPKGQWEAEYSDDPQKRGHNEHGLAPSETFADYYAAGATGVNSGGKRDKRGVIRGTSEPGYVQVDPRLLRRFTRALDRVRRRQGLPAYK